MWFTGRFSGAATVLVLEPSQVTGLPAETGAFDAEMSAAGLVVPVAGLASEEQELEEELEPEPEGEAPDEGAREEEFAVGVVAAEAPSSWTPVPSLHAVSESAARTTVAAAPTSGAPWVRTLSKLTLNHGDRIMCFTDGLIEAHEVGGEEFGEEQLIGGITTDDATLLLIEWHGAGAGRAHSP
jgi:hypothetical protein